MAEQKRIIDQRLGLTVAPRLEGKEQKPIGGHRPWKSVAAEYEAKERKRYWKDYIERNEAAMGSTVNDVKVQASPEPIVQEEVDEIAK